MKQNCVSKRRIWGRDNEIACNLGRNVQVRDYRVKCMRNAQNLRELVGPRIF